MRLAEFKLRLFLFFAGRMLKWAGRIEQEIALGPAPLVAAVDGGSAALAASSRGAAVKSGGPPEHWMRLVAKPPPEPWLELLRQKAPHLLDSLANEPASPQIPEELADSEAEDPRDVDQRSDDWWSREESAGNEPVGRLQFPSIVSPSRRGERTEYLGKTRARTWLDRLRFAPPPPPTSTDAKPDYITHRRSGEVNSADYSAEQARSAGTENQPSFYERRLRTPERADQTTTTPDQSPASRKSLARPAHYVSVADSRSVRRQVKPDYPEAPALDRRVGSESFLSLPPRPLTTEQISREPIRERRRAAAPEPSLEWTTTKSARARSNDTNYSSSKTGANDAASVLTFADWSPSVTAENGKDAFFSAPHSAAARVNESDRDFDRTLVRRQPITSPWQTLRKRIVDYTNYPEPAATTEDFGGRQPPLATNRHPAVVDDLAANRHQALADDNAASVEQSEFASTDLDFNSAGGPVRDVWPTLPPAPTFEIADELVAREAEAEDLRRLEQEQRGTAWNA